MTKKEKIELRLNEISNNAQGIINNACGNIDPDDILITLESIKGDVTEIQNKLYELYGLSCNKVF
jgi:hypothetical protein